ncbi:MAG: autotransporter outer membrane beta-barrel domain-containing protein, partial [Alphaproteobacteria bacterium]|nr:autotransporter outer membrane beta-barrel domain-containing protein [Alphaproteobacteria bacterium]
DGTFGTALNTGKVLNLIGVDNQSDILVGASANTTMTISNTIVTTGDVVFGAGGATGKTVTLNIARTSQYNASSTVPVLVFNAADDDVDNTGILAVTVSGNGIYGFDNGDLITVIDSNVNAELDGVDTTYTAQIAAGRVILRDTALVDLQDNGSDAQDLKVKVVHNNVNNVLTSSYAANTGAAILSINDANYAGTGGTEWGTTGVSGPLGAIAPNSAAEAGVGGGNTLRVARNNLLAAPTAESATNIAESLAPMVDGGSMVGAMNATNGSFNVTGDRLASLRGDATGMAAGNGTQGHRFWIQGFGSAATQDRRDGVDGYDADTFGMAVGLDTETLNSNGILGVALSYANTDVDSNAGFGGTSDVDSYQVTLYGDYDLDQATFINGMLAYSWHDIDTTRNNVGGIVGATARGSNDADQWTAQANLGRDYAYDSMTLTPSLLANWSHYNADDYTETGAGNANLIVDSDSVSVFELGVGLNASWAYQTASGMDVEPSLHAGYRYDFIGDEVSTTNRFVGGGPTFQADGADPSKHGFNVGGAMALYTTDAWEFTANYDYDFRSDYDAHSGYIRAGVKF